VPNKFLLASAAVAAGLVMSASAQAGVETFTFTGYEGGQELTATMTLDVVGGQAVSGTGTISSPYWTGSDALTLVTWSTPDVNNNAGGGDLSYRFGGGTDLIGDTSVPIDGSGLVFKVAGAPALDLGFNIWSNGGDSYTGFLAGNSPTPGGSIIYDSFTGQLVSGVVPEPATWAMLILGVAMLGIAARRRKSAGAALAA
jgi:hypothetical protein